MLDIDPELFGDATLTDGVVEDGRIVLNGCENDIAGSRRDTWGFPVWLSDGDADWRFAKGPLALVVSRRLRRLRLDILR